MTKDKEIEIQMQFLEEATDYLNTLEGVLLDIDTSKRIDLDKINAAMRAAHSIKGGAAMMGFRVLSDLAHRLEDAFKVLKARKNATEIDTHLQSLLLSGVDWLRQIVDLLTEKTALDDDWLGTFCYPIFDELQDILGHPPEEDITTIIVPEDGQEIIPLLFETEVEEYLQSLETLLANSEHTNLATEVATMATELGGLGEMLQLNTLTQLCQSINSHLETAPTRSLEIAQLALQAWRRFQALVLTNQRHSLPTEIKLNSVKATHLLAAAPEQENSPVLAPEAPSTDNKYFERKGDINYHKDRESHENTVRLPSKYLEEISDLFGEIIIQRNGLNVHIERLRKLVAALSQRVVYLDQEQQELRAAYEKILNQTTILNHTEDTQIDNNYEQKLKVLSQDITETIVQVAEVTSDIKLSVDDTDQITRKFNKTSKQLQRKLTQVRMRPLADLVDRFPRAIRDLNVEYGKNVQLKIEGGNTLIERSILDALNEPLMHLLRNAFDHGIEDPATRRAQGKPEQGLIEIQAAHQSQRTIITMRDDGRGISLEKIRQRALAMGLDSSLLTNASEEELLSLIFEPGFTTSDQVTALSGRGVGMDVVRNKLKSVRGEVKVDTQLGVGTIFTLSVPFTLSVARVLLVESDRLLFAFSTDVVTEILLLTNDQVFTRDGQEFLTWQEQIIPLIRFSRYFVFNCSHYDLPELDTNPVINATSVLIIKQDNQLIGVQIDRCWGEQEVAVRHVEGTIALPKGFSNCTILGDGRVVPMININDLIAWTSTGQRPSIINKLPHTQLKTAFLSPPKAPAPVRPVREKGMILIVDDSINVRRYLALTLEKGGYQVEQAKDGQDAWEKLESGLKVQAVICDIEMPRLDGYSFLEKVSSHLDLKNIPVAMLTSRSSNKHRQLAMQLGARAYFSKPYNEQELLKTLEDMIFIRSVEC
jgi:chemotaxis family two-component system sensor histidine kinase/response regulator PixL